jgi:DNA-binding response OmpR family regulator
LKALVVEESNDIAEIIETIFMVRWTDAEIIRLDSGAHVADVVESQAPDILILDLGLPDVDGVNVLKRVREFSDVPVIILTARADEASRVRGLEAGADDYVTKPFSHIELLARTRAVLRRSRGVRVGDQTAAVTVGGVMVDMNAHRLIVDGAEINLTPTEWSLMGYFIRNQGKVAQHQVLAEKVWGTNAIDPSVIKTAVLRLRKKLGDHAPADLIRTHRGLGYSFAFATN